MPDQSSITLTTNIAALPGVGSRRSAAFGRMNIRCVADLLLHLPLRYESELPEQGIGRAQETIGPAHGAEQNIAVSGEVATTRLMRGRRSRVQATLEDGTGTILLTWFNAPWMRDRLHPGMRIRVWGKAKRHGDYVQLVNPRWESLEGVEEVAPRGGRLRPVYPGSEDLASPAIEATIDDILEPALRELDDHFDEDYRSRQAMPTLAEAYRMIHRPADESDIARGRRRLAFDELLMLQLAVMLKRRHRRETLRGVALRGGEAIDRHITRRLPFKLTDAQRCVVDEIAADLAQTTPMNRLLQGDVGAGKTVVAVYAMLMAVASEHQAALMAPTELLAEQHYASITEMLAGAKVTVELLTGSLKAAQRADILERLASGAIDLLIGTHALITHTVAFKSLAVAVVDEQHRFGVHQRAMLRTKNAVPGTEDDEPNLAPHVLVMTATPIPRTLSLTVFGDLDVSTIRALPPGRQPIITRHVPRAQAGEVYAYLAERIGRGEQAYVVVPVIDESDSGLTDVHSHIDALSQGPLRGRRLAAMHGRLPRAERDEIMGRFRAGDLDVLVATSVIEVGVDVPDATVIVIEHADRFGLAQLHQLRGRVGRSVHKSLCVLIADPLTDDARARLDAISATNDGFLIAEKDLEIRGPGELFGARQSGLAPFRVATFPRDLALLRMARREAERWIEENPELAGERDALLRRRLLKAHGKTFGLGDVA